MMFVTAILSLAVGLSLGLLGGGGSILMVPILRYVAGLEAHEAIALSLLVVGTTSLTAVVPHARRGNVQLRTGLIFGSAGMVGAYAAGRVSGFIPAGFLLVGFGLMMLVTAGAMIRKPKVAPSAAGAAQADDAPRRLPVLHIVIEGLIVGGVTGLVGAGGGFLVVPALVLLGGLSMSSAVGTSLVVIALKSFAGFFGYVGHVHIDTSWAIWITVAAIVGSVVGSRLTTRLTQRTLRTAFGWFVLAMAFFVMTQELPALLGFSGSVLLSGAAALVGPALAYALYSAAVPRNQSMPSARSNTSRLEGRA